MSPVDHALADHLKDEETKARHKHLALLADPTGLNILKTRATVLRSLRSFLEKHEFVEVHTPIIGESAGGAVARPFYTHATELNQSQLALRISPELWLKRLIIGGMERIYEIGPCFRNEGIRIIPLAEYYSDRAQVLMQPTIPSFGPVNSTRLMQA